jgi:hypothetical protein
VAVSEPLGGMFVALDHVRDPEMLRDLSPAERHVLLAVATYVGRHGTAHPSLEALADLTGYQRRSVIRIVNRLCDRGRLIRRRGGGRGRSSVYIVAGPPWLEVVHNGDQQSVTHGHRNDVTVTETVTETVTPRSPQGEGEGVVHTERDAISRAAPPWIAQGITLREWQRRQRAAGQSPGGFKQADYR